MGIVFNKKGSLIYFNPLLGNFYYKISYSNRVQKEKKEMENFIF